MILGRSRKRQPSVFFPWMPGTKTVSVIALILLVMFSLYKLKDAHFFPIKEVRIFGIKQLNPEDMQSRLTPLVSRGFFSTDVDAIKERLLQYPWVEDVSVRRVWPDQVVVTLSEKTAVSRWNNEGLLSVSGENFNPDIKTYPAGLPQFIGSEGEQLHMLEYYNKINQLIEPLHFKITRFELTPYLSWSITFDNGMKVNVGYKDILTRISHFVKVYPKIVGERAADVDYIDLRYPNGLAVRWKSTT